AWRRGCGRPVEVRGRGEEVLSSPIPIRPQPHARRIGSRRYDAAGVLPLGHKRSSASGGFEGEDLVVHDIAPGVSDGTPAGPAVPALRTRGRRSRIAFG